MTYSRGIQSNTHVFSHWKVKEGSYDSILPLYTYFSSIFAALCPLLGLSFEGNSMLPIPYYNFESDDMTKKT